MKCFFRFSISLRISCIANPPCRTHSSNVLAFGPLSKCSVDYLRRSKNILKRTALSSLSLNYRNKDISYRVCCLGF